MKWSPLSEEEVIRQMGFSIQRHMHRMACQDRMAYRSAFNQHREVQVIPDREYQACDTLFFRIVAEGRYMSESPRSG